MIPLKSDLQSTNMYCLLHFQSLFTCLQCFDAVGWAAGRASYLQKKLSGGMLAWLSVRGKVRICIWPSWCHCHSLSLAPVNPDWFYLPGFIFLVPAHPGNPEQSPGGHKMVVVVVVALVFNSFLFWNYSRLHWTADSHTAWWKWLHGYFFAFFCSVFFFLLGVMVLLTLMANNSTIVQPRPKVTTEH